MADRSLLSGASCVTQLGWGQQAIHPSISHSQECNGLALFALLLYILQNLKTLVTIGVNYSRKHRS